MRKPKTKYHVFRIKVMRAPPGAPPIQVKLLDSGQSRPAAYYELEKLIIVAYGNYNLEKKK